MERRRVAGVDLGWEVDRSLRTRVAFRPRLTDWARTGVEVSTIYLSRRNADLVELRPVILNPDRAGGAPQAGSAPALLRNVDGQRNLSASLSIDPARAGEGWWNRAFDPLSLNYASGVTSRFDREAVDPGFVYQTGWGRREDFLTIGSDSASTLSERDRLTLRGGVRLPASATLRVAFDRSFNEVLATRSDRDGSRRVWPDVSAAIGEVPLPGFLAAGVDRLSLSSGYRREERTLEFGEGSLQDRLRQDREVPVAVTLAVRGGATLSYRGRVNRGESSDPAGDTRRRANSHSLSVSARLRPLLGPFRARGAPLRATLDVAYLDELQCRESALDSPCVAFIDQLERSVSLALDSSVQDYQLGIRLRYLDRRSFVGLRAGSTHFQLNVFGRFLLTSELLSQP